jgi:hypothetical protein
VRDAVGRRVQAGHAEQQRYDDREEDREADDAVAQGARLRCERVGVLLRPDLLLSDLPLPSRFFAFSSLLLTRMYPASITLAS